MRYYYKRPSDWVWRQLNTNSIEAAARGHRVGVDWRYRVEGDSTNRTLAELIEMERGAREQDSHTPPVDPAFTAPDETWGYITVLLCGAALAFILVVPSQQPHSGGKFWLSSMVLIWRATAFGRLGRRKLGSIDIRHAKGLTNHCSQPRAALQRRLKDKL